MSDHWIGSFLIVWVEVRTYFIVFVCYQSTPPALWAWLTNQTGSQNSSQFLPEWVPWLSASSLNNFGNREEFCHTLSPLRLWLGKFFTRRHYFKLFITISNGKWGMIFPYSPFIMAIVWSSHEFSSATLFMVFNVTYTIAKGLNWMPRGFTVSHLLIDKMILFVNISNLLKWKFIHIMASNIAYWDAWDDNFIAFQYAKGRYYYAY